MTTYGEYPGTLDSPRPTPAQRAAYLAWQEVERQRQHDAFMAAKRRKEIREAWGAYQLPRWLRQEVGIPYRTCDCGYR